MAVSTWILYLIVINSIIDFYKSVSYVTCVNTVSDLNVMIFGNVNLPEFNSKIISTMGAICSERSIKISLSLVY